MKTKNFTSIFCSLGLMLLAAIFAGCSTPQSVGKIENKGKRKIYDANYDRVWNAAVASAQQGDLQVLTADKTQGFISAKRGVEPTTFGENVAIWVHHISDTQTEVVVVSRQAGPPVLSFRNWEQRVLNAISADLTTT